MTLHRDLLAQADHLARREPKRPRQASLRRAISAAYYALFHMLTGEAASVFVKDHELACRISRSYAHGEMAKISKSFAKGEWPAAFNALKANMQIPQQIKDVAQAFVDLQQARHEADYNLARKFTRSDAVAFVAKARAAFTAWQSMRKSDLARIYLSCFVLWDDWNKER